MPHPIFKTLAILLLAVDSGCACSETPGAPEPDASANIADGGSS